MQREKFPFKKPYAFFILMTDVFHNLDEDIYKQERKFARGNKQERKIPKSGTSKAGGTLH